MNFPPLEESDPRGPPRHSIDKKTQTLFSRRPETLQTAAGARQRGRSCFWRSDLGVPVLSFSSNGGRNS